ncbi:unnamed protein product, partial [Prorocentrum cordatum]
GPEILVRINPLDADGGELWGKDLAACAKYSDGFMLPKINSAADVEKIAAKLDEVEASVGRSAGRKNVLLPIATETAEGVLNLAAIAKACPGRVVAITWGAEDLSAEIGASRNRESGGADSKKPGPYLEVFQYVRQLCLLAAKAANIQAIDGVFADVRDLPGCESEAAGAAASGWDGKLSLHPAQVQAIHAGFAPSATEIQEAASGGGNRGALLYKGRMLDKPHLLRARKLLARLGPEGVPTEGKPRADAAVPFKRVFHGKYFDEMEVGDVIVAALTRTVTEADNVLFTCLSMNPAPIHLDHELSKQGEFGGKPLFNSMFTLALGVGMSVLETTHGTTVANLGFSEVKFPRPVFPGDTLRVETEVVDKRESASRPTQGIVTLRHMMYNQKGENVCIAQRQALMMKKPVAKM